MPTYKVDKDIYDIPETDINDFEKQYPNASVAYNVDGEVFDIPASEKNDFISQYPKAKYHTEDVKQSTDTPIGNLTSGDFVARSIADREQNDNAPYMLRPPLQDIPVTKPNVEQNNAPQAIDTINNGASVVFTGKELGIKEQQPVAPKEEGLLKRMGNDYVRFFSPENNAAYLKNVGNSFVSSGISALSNVASGFEEQAIKVGTAIKDFSQNPSWQKFWGSQVEGSKENLAGARKFGEKAKPMTGAPGEFLGGMLPFVGTAAAAIMLKNPYVASGMSVGFGEMGYGEGVKVYDDFKTQTGQPINESERTGAGALYAVAYTAPVASYLGKMMPKNLFAKAIQGAMSANPEATATMGREVFDNFARKSPSLAKQLAVNIAKGSAHGVAAMETMTLSKLAVDDYLVGKDIKPEEYWNAMAESAASGILFGSLTAPFATISQSQATKARRDAQGFVTITKDAKGGAVEILVDKNGNNIGLTPYGKQVKLSQEQIDNSFTLTTNDFNSAMETFGQTKRTPIDIERTAYLGRTSKMLDNIADKDGSIFVPTDANSEVLALIGRQNGKMMGVTKDGQPVEVSEDMPTVKVNKGQVYQVLRDKYDEGVTAKDKREMQKAYEQAEATYQANPTPETEQAYNEAKEQRDGVMRVAQQRAIEASEQVRNESLENSNKDTGRNETAILDNDILNPVKITRGNYEEQADPNSLHKPTVTIKHADGTIEQVEAYRVHDVVSEDAHVVANLKAEEAKNAILVQSADELAYSPENQLSVGMPVVHQGANFTIEALHENGSAMLADENGKILGISQEELRDAIQEKLDAVSDITIASNEYEMPNGGLTNESIEPASKAPTTNGQDVNPTPQDQPVVTKPIVPATALDQIPRIKVKGQEIFDFESSSPKQTADAFVEIYDGNKEDEDTVITHFVNLINKEKAEFHEPNGRIKNFSNASKYLDNKNKIKAFDLRITFWDEVREQLKSKDIQTTPIVNDLVVTDSLIPENSESSLLPNIGIKSEQDEAQPNTVQTETPTQEDDVYRFRMQGDEAREYLETRLTDDAREINLTIKKNKLREAWQDRMISVREMIKQIEKSTGKQVPDFMNPYMAENHASSISTYQVEKYDDLIMKPLIRAISELSKGGSVHDVYTYMISKHGLERNEKMRDKAVEQAIANGGDIDSINDKDFSGLTAIAEELNGSPVAREDVDEFIRDYVKKYETGHNTIELWNKTNTATKETLKKWFDSGMLTKEAYEEIRDMYEYYIPLRGWDKPTAEDVYNYISSPVDDGSFDTAVKKAKGRTTRADDPLAHIATMAHTTIVAGNKNLAKQRMLWMAVHFPNESLYSVSGTWIENVGTEKKPIWKEMYPEYEKDDTQEQRKDKLDAFNERMNGLRANKMAYQGRRGVRVGLRISPYHEKEHQIKVYENGKEFIININIDPTIAQAINGKLNSNINESPWARKIDAANRWMAANFTTRNVTFMPRNLLRDIAYANTMSGVRENGEYAKDFRANMPIAMGAITRYLAGKQDLSRESDKLLQEFFENGGETGYVALKSIDDERKQIQNLIKRMENGKSERTIIGYAAHYIDTYNRWAEGMTRFSIYLTSRNSGRTIPKSISDAKDSTVNFNRKGSGMMVDEKVYGKTLSMLTSLSAYPSKLWLFFNASTQGLQNFASAGKKKPAKFAFALARYMMLGAMMPLINSLIQSLFFPDDEKDKYDNVPPWVRRNCIVMSFGDYYAAIPLPIALRAFYGAGEMLTQKMLGRMQDENIALEIGSGMLESLSPVDISGGAIRKMRNKDGQDRWYVGGLLPDFSTPLYEAYEANEDWLGDNIAKKSPYNTLDPEYIRTYKGVNKILMKGSEFLNDITGGDEVKKGWADISILNPASVEHLFNSYFGGLGKTINQSARIMMWGWDKTIGSDKPEEEKQAITLRDIPIVSGLTGTITEQGKESVVREKYFKQVERLNEYNHLLKGYKNLENKKDGLFEFAKKYDDLINSSEAKKMSIVKRYKRLYDDISDDIKNRDVAPQIVHQYKQEQIDLINEMFNELKPYEDEKNH